MRRLPRHLHSAVGVLLLGIAAIPTLLPAASGPAPLSTVALPMRMFPEDRTNRENRLALAIPPPMESRDMTVTKLVSEVSAFKNPPVSTSEFSHIVVPFDTNDRKNREGANEAYAFSLLLQSTLRWSDAAYQTLDPLSFYRVNKDLLMLTSRTLHRDGVKRIAKDAEATCVITGTLKRDDKKYTADVGVFDDKGAALYKKDYKEPLGFFELLARVTVDISTALGHPIPPTAKEHIEVQRCQYRRSLLELGSLVYEDDRRAELKTFTGILERDPGFAEARVWAASEGHLVRGDKAGFARHVREAFSSYMTPEAVDAFITTDALAVRPDLTEEDRAQLTTLLGPEHPFVLTAHLMQPHVPSVEIITLATRIAATHPADPYLLETLADVVSTPGSPIVDLDLASELIWTSLQCRPASPGVNGTYRITRKLGSSLLEAGNADFAARVMDSIFSDVNRKDGYAPTIQDTLTYYAALRQNRRYEDAFNAAMMGVLITKDKTPAQADFIVKAGFAAALAGDPDMVQDLLSKFQSSLTNHSAETALLESYVILLRDSRHAEAPENSAASSPALFREKTLMLAQLDLMKKEQTHRPRLETLLQKFPMDRELWTLYDDYDRQATEPHSVFFYESLNWLVGTDPWVVRAVADFRDRTEDMRMATITNEDWDAILAAGSTLPLPSPQALAASIQPLLLKKKFEQAELRIRDYANRLPPASEDPEMAGVRHSLQIFCEHLLRLTQCHVLFPGT